MPADFWVKIPRVGSPLRLRAYEQVGTSGPSVVFLHGLSMSVDVLREVMGGFDPYARLAAEGFNVLGVDWPGHGRSGGPRGHLTFPLAMTAAAEAVGAALRRWPGHVGLFGTSFGGPLAFYAALADQRVGAVACHNAVDLRDVRPALLRARQRALAPLTPRLTRHFGAERANALRIGIGAVVAWTDLAEDPGLVRRLRRHPQAVTSYDLESLLSLLLDPADKPAIAHQKTPTLVAVGSHDRVLPETSARSFGSQLRCEHQLWVLAGAGHQLPLEHPDALFGEVGAFLHANL